MSPSQPFMASSVSHSVSANAGIVNSHPVTQGVATTQVEAGEAKIGVRRQESAGFCFEGVGFTIGLRVTI